MLSDDDSSDDDSSYDIDQLVQYLAEPRHPSLSIGDLPIAYWTGNSSHWPKLTSMALDIFAVPAISVMILTLHRYPSRVLLLHYDDNIILGFLQPRWKFCDRTLYVQCSPCHAILIHSTSTSCGTPYSISCWSPRIAHTT
jgi:hypothetical protein